MNINEIKNRFTEYSGSFLTGNTHFDFHITLKQQHSLLVAHYCKNICKNETADTTKINTSEAAGILHDIARFEQYKQFQTFQDAVSFDHGDYGAALLKRLDFYTMLDNKHFAIVEHAVRYHNKKEAPVTGDDRDFFTKIVRDADKLDIYRVFTEMFNKETGGTLTHHLPDTHDFSDLIIEDILQGKQIDNNKRKTQNDVKLSVLNWVQDLNFQYAFDLVLENDYINRLGSTLPDDKKIKQVIDHLTEFAHRHSGNHMK